MFENDINKMKELIAILNKASYEYYQNSNEIMTNFEFDKLYDQLLALEKKTNIVISNSPTKNVGYDVVSSLKKITYSTKMLSLNKTKKLLDVKEFLNNHECIVSWKLDGITIVLEYLNGELSIASTRGNGIVGEIVTNNVKTFNNVPIKIPYKGKLIIRGEALISYSEFEKLNKKIDNIDEKFKNPRNLCSGSIRQLDPKITKQRNIKLYVFSLIDSDNYSMFTNKIEQFEWLKQQGFEVVEYHKINSKNFDDEFNYFSNKVKLNDFPSDGLVVTYSDIKYSNSLGVTSKYPKDSIAFKWKDEEVLTKVKYVDFLVSRTGSINPVVVFDPIELEGSIVNRASIHNISILKKLQLGIGDIIKVYKANMIIPQISENITKSNNIKIPNKCPACGSDVIIKEDNSIKVLYCINPNCAVKKIKKYELLVSREALNISGLSEATLEKFLNLNIIKNPKDIYYIKYKKDKICNEKGFGEKFFNNLVEEIEKSRNVQLDKVIYGLGINGVGLQMSNILCSNFNFDFNKLKKATTYELIKIKGFGEVVSKNIYSFFHNEYTLKIAEDLIQELNLIDNTSNVNKLNNLKFVITGSLNIYNNREELKKEIHRFGGIVLNTITSQTDYLINNDIMSMSSKNKKAKELGIKIISENDFKNLLKN